jgi:hypothetical protein
MAESETTEKGQQEPAPNDSDTELYINVKAQQ